MYKNKTTKKNHKSSSFQKMIFFFLFAFLVQHNTPAQEAGDNYKSYIGGWLGGGYSALQHSIDGTSVPGRFGGLIGVGYQGSYDKWQFKTGAEFYTLNSTTKIKDYSATYPFLYESVTPPVSHDIDYNYNFTSYKDAQSTVYINIPLLIGYRFNTRYYSLLGVKYGINLFSHYKSSGSFTTKAQDPELPGEWENIPFHGIGAASNTSSGPIKLTSNIIGTAEFGVYLDEWIYAGDNARRARRTNNANARPVPNRPSYRLSLFVDYGFADIQDNETKAGYLTPATGEQDPLNLQFPALFASSKAHTKKLNTLLAGAKFTVLFQLTQEKRPPRQRTQRPTRPRFVAQIVDSETNTVLDAQVLMKRKSTGAQVFKQTSSKKTGQISRALNPSDYILEVSKPDYYTYIDTITTTEIADTMIVKLIKKPELTIQVIDAETKNNLEAEVTVENTFTGKETFKGTTDKASGLLSKITESGSYSITANRQGYLYKSSRVEDFVQSRTVVVELTPIKKDTTIILKNLFFDFDKSTIQPTSEQTLLELYELLKDNPGMKIKITGHTDNVGSDTYNQRLSENRARSVRDNMVKRGIDRSRITYEGKGSKEPLTTNDTEEGRAENRRVEFTIVEQ